MAIDFSKPVQTRDGRKVRILCVDRKSSQSIVGLITSPVDGAEELHSWHEDGRRVHGAGWSGSNEADLINVPERLERWVNVYLSETGCFYGTYGEARKEADADRLGVIRITFEDGKPVAVALEDV